MHCIQNTVKTMHTYQSTETQAHDLSITSGIRDYTAVPATERLQALQKRALGPADVSFI